MTCTSAITAQIDIQIGWIIPIDAHTHTHTVAIFGNSFERRAKATEPLVEEKASAKNLDGVIKVSCALGLRVSYLLFNFKLILSNIA